MDGKRFENLLAAMDRVGAASLHLVPGRTPLLRVQRRFVAGDAETLRPDDVVELTRDLLFADHRERLQQCGHVEVLYRTRNGRRYRAVVAEADGATSLVLRAVPEMPPRLAALELPEQVGAQTRVRSGLVVVAGFFGSGKSTTLAAMVEELNQDPARHIVTIEDSIQFVHQNGAALLHQREVGTHVATAADGVLQAMATGADVVVVTEVRDGATLDAALAAAESGCLVLVGVEAGSIVGALSELGGMVPLEERPRLRVRLARSLRSVLAQSLLHRSHRAGRIPVVEVLVANAPVRAAVRKGGFGELHGIMQRCRGLGMQTTDVALRALLGRHLVTAEEALLHATSREDVLGRAALSPR
ncbi:MAG: Flp pilus assembly complex ATPase component TadA [Planctomycetes bacterium]|nr:Flp pilus assembly complex ATPase component TadA [Planctomycetota bacterium]